MKKSDKNKVYVSYDQIIDWFDEHRTKDLSLERFYLDFIKNNIPVESTILDVGCGTGEPLAKYFMENFYKLTGVDASTKMIELCKQRFPKEKWVLADMRMLNLHEKFNAVIAWHSFFHLPHEDQRDTLKLLASYVKLGGLLVFTSGPGYSEEWGENGGYDLYHASLSSEEYEQILLANNFKVLIHNIEDEVCGGATVWIAQKN